MSKMIAHWQQLPCPEITDMLTRLSPLFNSIVFDCEHGSFSPDSLYRCLLASKARYNFVRIPNTGYEQVLRVALDGGVDGVIYANAEPNDIRLSQSRHHGHWARRGVSLNRSNDWGRKPLLDDGPLTIAQIEKAQTAAVSVHEMSDEFDLFMVGYYDLSRSLRCSGDFDNPKLKNCVRDIINVVGKKRMAAHLPKVEPLGPQYDDYQFLAIGMDTTAIMHGIDGLSSHIESMPWA